MKERIGFIGQGYVGKNYADNFEARGYDVVRYALEEPYKVNKDEISKCDIVFIGVPTPTTPSGFDSSAVRETLQLIGPGKIAVVKSTVVPGTTALLQQEFPDVTVLFSSEYLSESTAIQDVRTPFLTIIGTADESKEAHDAAELVSTLLPAAPRTIICTSTEAELMKYIHNLNGYLQVVFFNLIYDLASELHCDWETIRSAVQFDPYMNARYASPKHKSGRGAGGNCFIKDFAAFEELYMKALPHDGRGIAFFKAAREKNIQLLLESGKDINLLSGVYGEAVVENAHE